MTTVGKETVDILSRNSTFDDCVYYISTRLNPEQKSNITKSLIRAILFYKDDSTMLHLLRQLSLEDLIVVYGDDHTPFDKIEQPTIIKIWQRAFSSVSEKDIQDLLSEWMKDKKTRPVITLLRNSIHSGSPNSIFSSMKKRFNSVADEYMKVQLLGYLPVNGQVNRSLYRRWLKILPMN